MTKRLLYLGGALLGMLVVGMVVGVALAPHLPWGTASPPTPEPSTTGMCTSSAAKAGQCQQGDWLKAESADVILRDCEMPPPLFVGGYALCRYRGTPRVNRSGPLPASARETPPEPTLSPEEQARLRGGGR